MMETNGLAMHEPETKIKNKISRKGEKILSCIAVCDFPWAKVKLPIRDTSQEMEFYFLLNRLVHLSISENILQNCLSIIF